MNEKQREDFDKRHDCDLSYGTPDGVRYRVNIFLQRGLHGMVLRIIPPDVLGFDHQRSTDRFWGPLLNSSLCMAA